MSKRKLPTKNAQERALSRRNLMIASIVGITVILTFLIEIPQKISATIDVFRTTETPALTNTPTITTAPTNTVLPISGDLQLVGVSIVEESIGDGIASSADKDSCAATAGPICGMRPHIDIKVRNTSNEPAFLKKATFHVKQAVVLQLCAEPFPYPVSWVYDVSLRPWDTPYTETMDISQVAAPHDVDRFQFRVDYRGSAGSSALFLIDLALIYNETNDELRTGEMLLLVPSDEGAWAGGFFEDAGCAEQNISAVEPILMASVLRYKAIDDLEALIAGAKSRFRLSEKP